ncbi:hypothetical protein RCH18_002137 [Flavobacterium sp. PL11]|jgi:hypothetical protein|nr:hypothetical protein [Flavobacterium sp. PL11]
MKGLLKEKSEIEKLKMEYEKLSKINFNIDKTAPVIKEMVLEECEL